MMMQIDMEETKILPCNESFAELDRGFNGVKSHVETVSSKYIEIGNAMRPAPDPMSSTAYDIEQGDRIYKEFRSFNSNVFEHVDRCFSGR